MSDQQQVLQQCRAIFQWFLDEQITAASAARDAAERILPAIDAVLSPVPDPLPPDPVSAEED